LYGSGVFVADPLGALGPNLFLPNGDGLLEGVDGEPSGLEGFVAVRRSGGDGDADVAYREAAQTVHDGYRRTPPAGGLGRDARHLGTGQGLIGLVLKVVHIAPAGVFAHGT